MWTEEVGVVTGQLTLRTELSDDLSLTLRVQYKDADEWYVIRGGRVRLGDADDLEPVHRLMLGVLDRPEG
ncbi:hypothetical protein GCM10023322_67700 [Rugosimonospora acidiphila]|uniref:Uncharacterized protein n=1 Tax=Rugosimonospora acidiphila TaxID=556531 RepID=A0ABP9SJX6_9ACTN